MDIRFITNILILPFLLNLLDLDITLTDQCVAEKDGCTCKFSNGSYVSLLSMNDRNSIKYPDLEGDTNYWSYDYNPCTPFTEGDPPSNSDCDDVILCQVSKNKDNYFDIGSPGKFSTAIDVNGNVRFDYIGGNRDSPNTRHTRITLICDQKAKPDPIISKVMQDYMNNEFSFSIRSKCACADGCSADPDDENK